MKSITIYINEKLIINNTSTNDQISNNGVDTNINSLIKGALSNLDFKKIKSFSLNDSTRFDISKENEKLFIDAFEDSNLKAISSIDYYNANHPDEFKNLSSIEKAKIDRTLGDVVLVDATNGEAKYYIDLKISGGHIGAISMGSLSEFNNDGIYVCINKASESYVIVSHKVIAELVNSGTLKIRPAVNKKGYTVEFNGQKYNSEDFIKGDDIEIHIK